MNLGSGKSLLGLTMVFLLVHASFSQNMSSTAKPSSDEPNDSGAESEITTEPSDAMTCGTIECPPESVSCLVIVQTDPNNQTLVIVTSKCMDSTGLTVAQNATSEPNSYGADIWIEILDGVMFVRQVIQLETALATLDLIGQLEYVAELEEIREKLAIDNEMRDLYYWG